MKIVISPIMTKNCHNCKYWTECSHNHGSAWDGYCNHPSSRDKITDGHSTCDNWFDCVPKEMREIDMFIKWLKTNKMNVCITYKTERHPGADMIYTVTHKETNQSFTVCKSANCHYNITNVNGYDTKLRYMNYYIEVRELFNEVLSIMDKICPNNEEQIQQAIDSFKV